MTAKTIAKRQADLRQRRADEGLTEVRGLYAKPEHHAKIKAFGKSLQGKQCLIESTSSSQNTTSL